MDAISDFFAINIDLSEYGSIQECKGPLLNVELTYTGLESLPESMIMTVRAYDFI